MLEALQPTSALERVKLRLARGYTPVQVLDRLPPALVATLCGHENPVAARRQALDVVAATLRSLSARGLAVRTRARLSQDVRVKGTRLIEIDVFRVARRR